MSALSTDVNKWLMRTQHFEKAICWKTDTDCGLDLNKTKILEDVFFCHHSHLALMSPVFSNFHPFILHFLSYYLSRDDDSNWGNKHLEMSQKNQRCADLLFVRCSLVTPVFSVIRISGLEKGWMDSLSRCTILVFCSPIWETGACGQLQQSAVMSHGYRARGWLSQWELMYQDGILS